MTFVARVSEKSAGKDAAGQKPGGDLWKRSRRTFAPEDEASGLRSRPEQKVILLDAHRKEAP
jgi:hypothetical protein